MGQNANWRERAQRAPASSSGGNEGGVGVDPGRRYNGPRSAAPRKRGNAFLLVAIAIGLVLAGIAVIIAIRQVAVIV